MKGLHFYSFLNSDQREYLLLAYMYRICEEQSLENRIHVACWTLIFYSHKGIFGFFADILYFFGFCENLFGNYNEGC